MKRSALCLLLCGVLSVPLSSPAETLGEATSITINVKSATLVPSSGPPMNVEGGVWLSDGQARRIAERLGEKKIPDETLDTPQVTLDGGGWVLPAVLGFSLGVLGGLSLAFLR